MKAEYIITIDGEKDINGGYPIIKKEELIRCKDCMHNGSFDTDCPIKWRGRSDEDFCSYAEILDEKAREKTNE